MHATGNEHAPPSPPEPQPPHNTHPTDPRASAQPPPPPIAVDGIPCPSCGYDLTGLTPSINCPECGLLISPRIIERHHTTTERLKENSYGLRTQSAIWLIFGGTLTMLVIAFAPVLLYFLIAFAVLFLPPYLIGFISPRGMPAHERRIGRDIWGHAVWWFALPYAVIPFIYILDLIFVVRNLRSWHVALALAGTAIGACILSVLSIRRNQRAIPWPITDRNCILPLHIALAFSLLVPLGIATLVLIFDS